MISLGNDFSIEHINPLYGFHTTVARQDAENHLESGFQMESALSRESIEPGKWANFVLLEEDIMKITEEKLHNIKVLKTYIGGFQRYSYKN